MDMDMDMTGMGMAFCGVPETPVDQRISYRWGGGYI